MVDQLPGRVLPASEADGSRAEDLVPFDAAGLEDGELGSGRAQRAHLWRRLRRSPSFLLGAAVLTFWIAMAIVGPAVGPYDPYAPDARQTFLAPSGPHWAGTDELGRDVFSRVLAGARGVFTIALPATLIALVLGTLGGLYAGYYRGILDEVLMRTVDAFLALPGLIIAVVVLGLIGPSDVTVILLIGFFFSPLIARTVRSAVLSQREREFVRAARMRGEGGPYIMFIEILPNVTAPIIVEATIRFGYAVFLAATLSFLGLGLQPPSADWGLTVATERGYLETASWTVLAPAIALASLVVSVNLVADGLRRGLLGAEGNTNASR